MVGSKPPPTVQGRCNRATSWTGSRRRNWSPWPAQRARRAGPLDDDALGRPAGRAEGGAGHRPVHRLADASKNDLKPWLKQQWVIPPEQSGAFVAAMEDVIEVYHRPPDPARPVVCVDEGGKQLVGDVREPLPVRPGSAAKQDYEYERHGVANLFMAFEPLAGQRVVEVTDRRTAVDFARFLSGSWTRCIPRPSEWCWSRTT